MRGRKNFLLTLFTFFLYLLTYSLIDDISNKSKSEKELLALQFFNQGEYAKALQLYEQLFKKTQDIYLYDYYFQCLIELRQYKEAEKLTRQLAKKNPNVFRYQVDLGIVYLRWGDIKNAEKIFLEAIKNIKPTEENYHSLAQYFKFRQLDDYVIKTYEHGIAQLPQFKSLYLELAHQYWQKGLYIEAFELYYKLLDFPMVSIEEVQQKLQALLALDNSGDIKRSFKDFALQKIQQSSQNLHYSQMLLWAYLQMEDFNQATLQAIAIDRRQRADGDIVLSIYPVLISNKKYDLAIQVLEYIIEKGEKSKNYDLARSNLLSVKFSKAITQIPINKEFLYSLEREYKQIIEEIGISLNSLSLIEELAMLQAFYLDKADTAQILLEKVLQIKELSPLLTAKIKLQLADIMLLTNQRWDASLMYLQVERNFMHDTIGYRAKFKNAKFYYYIGEFEYAKTQLDVIKSATSRLIANDAIELSLFIANSLDYDSSWVPLQYYSRAEFSLFQKKPIDCLSTLDSLLTLFPYHPLADDALFLKANVLLQLYRYDEALDALNTILSQYYFELLADDAVFLLANIYLNHYNNTEKAKELYWQLITDFPSSVYVNEAKENYRSLENFKLK